MIRFSFKLKYIIDNLLIFLIIILISGASFLSSSEPFLIGFAFLLLMLMLIRKRKLDWFIFLIIIFWSSINILSFLYNGTNLGLFTFWGYIIRFLIPYMLLKVIGISFWPKLEKVLYIMTIITLPIFLLQIFFPMFFESLYSVFNPLTNDVFYKKENQSMYWYSFFYTFSGRDDIRNSGFMWEPGAFAMILILLITYNWIIEGITFNKKILIYTVALATTFSTMGYLSFLGLIIAYFVKNKKKYSLIVIFILCLFVIPNIIGEDFMSLKITNYLDDSKNNVAYHQGYSDRYELNRYAYFFLTMEKSLRYPLGYGIVQDKHTAFAIDEIVGVNGLGEILVMWGWIGLIFVVISIYKYYSCFNRTDQSVFIIGLFTLLILMSFFSNPIERNPILFLIIFTPYIQELTKYKLKKNE